MDAIGQAILRAVSKPSPFLALLPKSKGKPKKLTKKQIAEREIQELRQRLQDALKVLDGEAQIQDDDE